MFIPCKSFFFSDFERTQMHDPYRLRSCTSNPESTSVTGKKELATLVTACGWTRRKSQTPSCFRSIHCLHDTTRRRAGLYVRLPNALISEATNHSSQRGFHPKKRIMILILAGVASRIVIVSVLEWVMGVDGIRNTGKKPNLSSSLIRHAVGLSKGHI
jgi:hypothetical protein